MTPIQAYEKKLHLGEIKADSEQLSTIKILDIIYHELIKRQDKLNSHISYLSRKIKLRKPIKGLYLFGNIGVGKSFMMDLFYECLPVKKQRVHFHALVKKVHQLLKIHQGIKNPLKKIAQEILDQIIVLCLDEFFVSNVADAMIIAELFHSLFARGICLVTTSNIAPDDLYKEGLQRRRFFATITMLKTFTTVKQLSTKIDYRLTYEEAGVYYTPLNESSKNNMEAAFAYYSNNTCKKKELLHILGYPIQVIAKSEKTVWFDFYHICDRPRSKNDYLELIKKYNNFLVSNVPILNPLSSNLIISWIHLIDVLYDNHKRLILSAEVPFNQLYTQGAYQTLFQRTFSRLIEIQSRCYLDKCAT